MSMKKMLAVVAAASLVAVAAPAFAANPFSDVPMNHWAYDALDQLSGKGILDGYPDGTFKGNRPMTRYEIAAMVARAMANGGDSEKLKALIVEFAPELEALGVKVDGFDGRLAKLEKGVGGFKLSGQMRYDYHAFDKQDNWKNGFSFNRARLFIEKDIDEKTYLYIRYNGGQFDRWYVAASDFMGMEGLKATLGSFYMDWEGDDGLHETNAIWDDESFFYDGTVRGAWLKYNVGSLDIEGFYGSASGVYPQNENTGDENYGARIKYSGEKFFVSANMYAFNGVDTAAAYEYDTEKGGDKEVKAKEGMNYKTYWFSLGFKPFAGVNVMGAYFMDDIEAGMKDDIDDPKAWKAVIAVDQDVLKFTNLRVEYAQYDEGWIGNQAAGMFTINSGGVGGYNTMKAGTPLDQDMDVIKVSAIQKWGEGKFSTYERWGKYDQDVNGDAKEWTVGVGYQYTPNLAFYLDYTDFDGRVKDGKVDKDYDNNMVRFRTFLNF